MQERFDCSLTTAMTILDGILKDLTDGDNVNQAEAEDALKAAVTLCQGGHTTIPTRFRFMCGCHGKPEAEQMVRDALVRLAKGETPPQTEKVSA